MYMYPHIHIYTYDPALPVPSTPPKRYGSTGPGVSTRIHHMQVKGSDDPPPVGGWVHGIPSPCG